MREKLLKSKNIQKLICGDKIILYNSLFGNVRVVDENSEILLNYFNNPHTLEDFLEYAEILEDQKNIVREIINDFIIAKFLLYDGSDERRIVEQDNNIFIKSLNGTFPFEFIGFNVTKKCNFACEYCIAGANKIQKTETEFDENKLIKYISKFADELIKYDKKTLNIGITGGEPLTYWEKLKYVMEEIYRKYREILDIEISINTNLSLMTDEIAHFFYKYNFKPFTSLDGVAEWNNKVRVYKNGKETFNDIINGISLIRSKGISCNSFYLTLTKKNFDFDIEQLINFAKKYGFTSITIEPDLINTLGISIDNICKKLIMCYIIGRKNGIDIMGFWRRPFDNMVDYESSRKGFCRALDFKSIVVDREGFISPCGYSRIKLSKLANFVNLVKNEQYIEFVKSNLRGNIEQCKGCEIEGVCKGGCMISREDNNSNVFEYRCKLYKNMTKLLLQNAEFID